MRDRKHDMFLGADGHLFEMARQLRLQETEAEKLLWSRLCKNQLGVKFRRQHPIYTYVVDFYCHSCRLVIEVDGFVHSTREAQFNDSIRTKAFTEFNIEVMRFTNEEVLFDIETVLEKVGLHLKKFPHV
jgi:very-short-patch-repair endonuclease